MNTFKVNTIILKSAVLAEVANLKNEIFNIVEACVDCMIASHLCNDWRMKTHEDVMKGLTPDWILWKDYYAHLILFFQFTEENEFFFGFVELFIFRHDKAGNFFVK